MSKDNVNKGQTVKQQKREHKMEKKKQLHGYFKWQIGDIVYEMIRIWLRKGNLKRVTESLFIITAQNNTITTNYINAKINYTQ